jgi:D-alanyl-D-alanine-carboxypeptidase/D-alanyl-D-alanine-endopeptidase
MASMIAMIRALLFSASLALSPIALSAQESAAAPAVPQADIAAVMQEWMAAAPVPGLAYGVVKDGRLIASGVLGVQDLQERRPVTAQTRFRIASMTKAFTAYAILTLAAEGKLRLDDPISRHLRETRGWAGAITVADLLHHTAGFVTDDPWGDRQQPMTEADFTRLISAAPAFSAAPRTRFEYSNYGYALLGRIVARASGQDYAVFVRLRILAPLGMNDTTFEVGLVEEAVLAQPYRWENGAWSAEPSMAHGAFGAMGGLVTTQADYAKWVAHLLSGWPAAADEPASSATLRDMARGEGFLHARRRPGKDAPDCRLSAVYAAGLVAADDCLLGRVLFHGGGYPGYGSHMLLLPDAGVGIFAFTNETYAGPSPPVWDTAGLLKRAGLAEPRAVAVSPALASAYAAAGRIWSAGSIDGERSALAMNFTLDRTPEAWARDLAALKAQAGACETTAPIAPTGALSGRFRWTCARGAIEGTLLLAPTQTPQIQALSLTPAR